MSESTGAPLPPAGRVAAIDYGTRRVGIAICDAARIIASPHGVHRPSSDERIEGEFYRRFVRTEEVVGFVVGLPIHADGNASRMSSEVRRFAAWLTATTGLPVAFQDERYTSVEAAGMLARTGMSRGRRKSRTDAVAAQIILTAWLESADEGRPQPGALDA
ncbi:MAG: Holliday junction resolvase RuvX [Planctomycetaceae bacterium]